VIPVKSGSVDDTSHGPGSIGPNSGEFGYTNSGPNSGEFGYGECDASCRKRRFAWHCLIVACGLVVAFPGSSTCADDAEALFVRRIQPLISEKCLPCHGSNPDDIKGGFDLRSADTLLRGGDSGMAGAVSGKPNESPLYLAVTRTHDDWSPMPPKEADRLTDPQMKWIREWIQSGMPWPDGDRVELIAKQYEQQWSAEDGVVVKTSGGQSAEWTNRKYQPAGLWAYQPVSRTATSATGAAAIDELIADRLPVELTVAPPVDARTFIRRATFDLTGLPPTPEEVAGFESHFASDAEQAVAQLVDRLLESPHYGERMAQHWLDVVRYADSSGFSNDYERGNAWRYRDYVIRSFNADKPYDQFVKEQIAGDELDAVRPESIVATGYLRMGPWELTAMEVARVARQRFLDDVTNSVGETFLAHSLQCARCHDHKFDPVPTRDYYAIQAVFATTQLAERAAEFLPSENTAGFEERQYLQKRQAEHQATLAELDAVLLQNAERWFQHNGKDPAAWNAAVEAARANPAKSGRRAFADMFSQARNALMRSGASQDEFPPKLVGFTPEQFGRERVARKGLERIRWEMDRYEPFALAVYSGRTPDVKSITSPIRLPENRLQAGELEATCILAGGDPFADGEKVEPGVLSVLPISSPEIPAAIEGRRRAFAEWVVQRDNPLTSRAIVNRIWMWHFGEPLAGNPNNFGSTGKRPTHPELFDWLAAELVERGWSIKSLHRLIMTSQAYRRSSQHPAPELLEKLDPQGSSLAVFRPRRLSAEELRDAMLAVTGELTRTLGGIPIRPEINLEAALQPRQVMGTFAAAWTPNPRPEQRHRRSIYSLKLRGLADPSLEVFNAPSADFSCERREVSTVTPQVFSLFNSNASYSRAVAFAARVLKEQVAESEKDIDQHQDEHVIDRCFELAFGRAATDREHQLCVAHWRDMELIQATAAIQLAKQPLAVRRDAVEENTGEKFSFDERLHANEEFIPDLQPADCDARTRALADVCLILFNTSEFSYVY
jgi:hypothetical protein